MNGNSPETQRLRDLQALQRLHLRRRNEHLYLLCKAALQRRRNQIAHRLELGKNIRDLDRMVRNLEKSLAALAARIGKDDSGAL